MYGGVRSSHLAGRSWSGYLRTVYNFIFQYTASCRFKTNPQTGQEWTDAERTKEAQRLYPRAALSLVAGFLEDESLVTIGQSWKCSLMEVLA